MSRLQELCNQVRNSRLVVIRKDELQDAVFDMTTAESALMGVADQLLSNTMPSAEQLAVLDMRLMEGSKWLLFDGGSSDLTADREVLRHALQLVALQQECRNRLSR